MRKLLRFSIALTAVAFAIVSPAQAQNINLSLRPAEVVAIVRATDRWPIERVPPPGWWTLQQKLKQAMAANPQAAAMINEKLNGR
jgi:hypothetical protein